jgi:hypothetical protein
MSDGDDLVRIALTREEALVLFEFVARAVDDENGDRLRPALQDDSELWALNAVHCLFERVLVEPFMADYDKRLAAARARLLEQCGPWPWEAGGAD